MELMIEPLWSAFYSTAFHLLAVAGISSCLGLVLAIAVRDKRMRPIFLVATQLSILLFLFYPRIFLSSATNLFLAQTLSTEFASSATGFALRAALPSFALSFLLFSLFLGLESNVVVAADYVRNSGRTSYAKLIPIALFPFYRWFFLVAAISFCLMNFQDAALGIAGPFTPGRYLSDTLTQRVDIDNSTRLITTSFALFFMALVMLLAPFLLGGFTENVARLAVGFKVRGVIRKPGTSPRRVLRIMASLTAWAVALVCIVYHSLLVGRLLGLLGSPYETRWPVFQAGYILDKISNSLDYGVAGSVVGGFLAIFFWFFRLRRDTAQSPLATFILISCAVLAFLPSSFYGAVVLVFVPNNVGLSPILFFWGLITGISLVTLLIGSRLFTDKAYRYDNIARIRATGCAFYLFLVEFGVLIISLVFIAGFANAVDGGFRNQLGIAGCGFGGVFLDKQGIWAPEARLLILILILLGACALWLLTHAEAKGRDGPV